jgi:hypothetical protein
VLNVRQELRLKKQLSIERVTQKSTTIYEHSDKIKSSYILSIKVRPMKGGVEQRVNIMLAHHMMDTWLVIYCNVPVPKATVL